MDLIKGSFNTSRNMDNVINARNITTAKEPADQRKIYAVDVENQATKDNLALILSNAKTMTKLLEKMTEHIYILSIRKRKHLCTPLWPHSRTQPTQAFCCKVRRIVVLVYMKHFVNKEFVVYS